jgi:starvation-inducible DNA-binding protein
MSSSAKLRRTAALDTPTDLKPSGVLNIILADMFALYLKTKNFHWHVSGPHFRDYHLLLDEQADQIFATTDAIAERVRKIGGVMLLSMQQRLSVHGYSHAKPRMTNVPVVDARAFWGALGCSCWAF